MSGTSTTNGDLYSSNESEYVKTTKTQEETVHKNETISPRYSDRGIKKNMIVLQEELKDSNERLKSALLQQESLVESSRKAKSTNEELLRDKRNIELRLAERDDVVLKLRKDIASLEADKSTLECNETKLREETSKFREERKHMSIQANKDRIAIQDLHRQCKEMEAILAKRHPDSVSALIVASKHPLAENSTKVFLDNRISQLENELKEQDKKYQKILLTVQEKVNAMKENYETHISDLEKQVVTLQLLNTEANNINKNKSQVSVALQTDNRAVSVSSQTMSVKPLSAKSSKSNTTGASSATTVNTKEDVHLIATVRGLTCELAQKEKCIGKLNRELEDSKKLIIKIQKGKEGSGKILPAEKVNRKTSARLFSGKSQKSSSDSSQTDTAGNKESEKILNEESSILKNDLNCLQSDYENLKKKRIEDLFALQTAHEKELMCLNVKVLPLQSDVESLNSTVEMLRSQIKMMDEQISVIMLERDHFKCRSELLNTKLVKASVCGSDRSSICNNNIDNDKDYDSLKMKVVELEKRYEGRELRLKTLVDSLAKLKDVQIGGSSFVPNFNIEGVQHSRSYLPFS